MSSLWVLSTPEVLCIEIGDDVSNGLLQRARSRLSCLLPDHNWVALISFEDRWIFLDQLNAPKLILLLCWTPQQLHFFQVLGGQLLSFVVFRQFFVLTHLFIRELLSHLLIFTHRVVLFLFVFGTWHRTWTTRIFSKHEVAAHFDIQLLVEKDLLHVLELSLILCVVSQLGIREVIVIKLPRDRITFKLASLSDSLLEHFQGLPRSKWIDAVDLFTSLRAFSQRVWVLRILAFEDLDLVPIVTPTRGLTCCIRALTWNNERSVACRVFFSDSQVVVLLNVRAVWLDTIKALHVIEMAFSEVLMSLSLALNASNYVILSQDWAESFQTLYDSFIRILFKFVTISVLIHWFLHVSFDFFQTFLLAPIRQLSLLRQWALLLDWGCGQGSCGVFLSKAKWSMSHSF